MLRRKVLVPLYNSARAAIVVGSQISHGIPSFPANSGPQPRSENSHAFLGTVESASHRHTWQTQADVCAAASQAGWDVGHISAEDLPKCSLSADVSPYASGYAHGFPSVQARADSSIYRDHITTNQAPGRPGTLAAHQGLVTLLVPPPKVFQATQRQVWRGENEIVVSVGVDESTRAAAEAGRAASSTRDLKLESRVESTGASSTRNVEFDSRHESTRASSARNLERDSRLESTGTTTTAASLPAAPASAPGATTAPPGQLQQKKQAHGAARVRGEGHKGVLKTLNSCVHRVCAAAARANQRKGGAMTEGQVVSLLNSEWDRAQGHTPSLSVRHVTEAMKTVASAAVAKGLLLWATEGKGILADPHLLSSYVSTLTRAQDVEGLDAVAQRLKSGAIPPNPWVLNKLLKGYKSLSRVSKALDLFEELKAASKGSFVDGVTYTQVMDIYTKEGKYNKAVQVFHEMMKAKLELSDMTLTTSMVAFSRLGDTPAVQRLYDVQRKRGPVAVATVNVLLSTLTKSGKHKEALKFLRRAEEGGLVPDLITYTVLLDSLSKQDLHGEAEALFAQLEEAGLEPDAFMWSCMIHMYNRQGDVPKLKYWFGRMIKSGCRPAVATLNSLLFGLLKCGQYDESKLIIDWMLRHGRAPNLKTYSHFLSECSEAQEATVRRALVELMSLTKHKAHWLMTLLVTGGSPGPNPSPAKLDEDKKTPVQEDLSGWFLAMEQSLGVGRTSRSTSARRYPTVHGEDSAARGTASGQMGDGGEVALGGEEEKWRQVRELLLQGFEAGGYDLGMNLVEERQSFVNAAVQFLVVLGLDASAARLWELCLPLNVYHGCILVRPQDWKSGRMCTVDLHSMSPGTAVLVTKWTLRVLERTFNEQGLLPEKVDFITGWGKRSRVTGSSVLRQSVEHLFAMSRIPLLGGNPGILTIRGDELPQWFKDQRGHGTLSLEDDRP